MTTLHVIKRRERDFNLITPFQHLLDLRTYGCSHRWPNDFARKVQISSGLILPDAEYPLDGGEMIRNGIAEEIDNGGKIPVSKLSAIRGEKTLTPLDIRSGGDSLADHLFRSCTIGVDMSAMLFDFSRLKSKRDTIPLDVQKLVNIVKTTEALIMAYHDIGKLSHFKGTKDDIYYIHCLLRKLSPEEYAIMQRHVDPTVVAEVWERVFRIKLKSIPNIVNIVTCLHHKYDDGSGYSFVDNAAAAIAALAPAERLMLSMAKVIDEAEAGTSKDRIWRKPVKHSKITSELNQHAREGKLPERVVDALNSIIVDDGGLSNLGNITVLPELKLLMRTEFRERGPDINRVMDFLSKFLESQKEGIGTDSVRVEAKKILEK